MWPDIMFAAVDSADTVDSGPIEDNKLYWMPLIYISFIMLTTFFAMNLFLSVVITKFQEETAKNKGNWGMTTE